MRDLFTLIILKWCNLTGLIFLILLAPTSRADNHLCEQSVVAESPTLSEGRVKPLMVVAREFRKRSLSDNCRVSDSVLYCELSIYGVAEFEKRNNCRVEIRVEHDRVREILKTQSRSARLELVDDSRFALTTEYQNEEASGRGETGYALGLGRVLSSANRLHEILDRSDWKVLDSSNQWVSLSTVTMADLVQLLTLSSERLTNQEQFQLRNEITLEKTQPFSWALVLALGAFLLAMAGLKFAIWYLPSLIAACSVLGIQAFGVVLRGFVTSRAPVTNMYETVMWAGLGALFMGIVIAAKQKKTLFLALALATQVIILFMMRFSTSMLDSSLRPLVPVLRDNFWLSTHVTTITLSYACFAFAWIISNVALVKSMMRKKFASLDEWNTVIRINIQVGTVLLAAGIILGGVWADYSWGRFWGWDPKETWSLIALIIYMMILHGKYAGWFRGLGFTQASAFAFMFVLMAWFGVNYILATGLHSYGFSSGGASFLLTVFLAQVGILTLSRVRSSFPVR